MLDKILLSGIQFVCCMWHTLMTFKHPPHSHELETSHCVDGLQANIITLKMESTVNWCAWTRGGQMGAKEPIVAPPGFLVALG